MVASSTSATETDARATPSARSAPRTRRARASGSAFRCDCVSLTSTAIPSAWGPSPSSGSGSRGVWVSIVVSGGALFRVLDAAVVDADQRLDQALADLTDLLEGQPALVKLAVAEPLVGQVADEVLDPRGGRLGEGPAGALDGVGHHQDAGLLGLRLGPGVAEGDL